MIYDYNIMTDKHETQNFFVSKPTLIIQNWSISLTMFSLVFYFLHPTQYEIKFMVFNQLFSIKSWKKWRQKKEQLYSRIFVHLIMKWNTCLTHEIVKSKQTKMFSQSVSQSFINSVKLKRLNECFKTFEWLHTLIKGMISQVPLQLCIMQKLLASVCCVIKIYEEYCIEMEGQLRGRLALIRWQTLPQGKAFI